MEGGEKMKKKSQMRFFIVLGVVLPWILVSIVPANDVPRITKEKLKEMLGNPEVIIIDVRANTDWNGSNLKIKGAVREDPRKLSTWEDKYPKDKTLVLYCA
jgi:3-mercaptopyruvate sulfurtransferase SseA